MANEKQLDTVYSIFQTKKKDASQRPFLLIKYLVVKDYSSTPAS